jgi:hypothetical protein
MQAVTRRRALVLVAVSITCYVIALLLMGVTLGFDHRATRWTVAAVLALMAVGLSASVLLRVALLVVDPDGRTMWWTNASPAGRAWRIVALLVRILASTIVWIFAIRALAPPPVSH